MRVARCIAFVMCEAIVAALCVFAFGLSLTGSRPASAQTESGLDRSLMEANAISVDIPLPTDRPSLTWLLRHPMKFQQAELLKKLFKASPGSPVPVHTPVYGDGTAYRDKSGATIQFFKYGFEYGGPTGKIEKVIMLGPGGEKTYVYTADEGKVAALARMNDIIGKIPDQGKDFTYELKASIGEEAEGLFVLSAVKYFRGIELLDDYIQVVLDANKSLVGFSYFWDDALELGPGVGEHTIIDAGIAVNQAKRWVVEQAGGQSRTEGKITVTDVPQLTLMEIKLGYISLRGDYVTVIPAWLLYCRSQKKITVDLQGAGDAANAVKLESWKPSASPRFVEQLERFDYYVAIEAISGRPTTI